MGAQLKSRALERQPPSAIKATNPHRMAKAMEPVPLLLYHDDRLFVLDICTMQVRAVQDPVFGELREATSSDSVDASSQWTLTTRRNCPGYPPVRVDHFETIADLVDYIRKVEPNTPRRSLAGQPPDPTPTYEDYLEWLEQNGLRGAVDTKLLVGGYVAAAEWGERLHWEARQLAEYLAAPQAGAPEAVESTEDSDLDYVLLEEFAATARSKWAEARIALAEVPPDDPIRRRPAEDMLKVCEIISSGVTESSDEMRLRTAIADLRQAMGSGLDAAAFMTARNVIELIRQILRDEMIDTGSVPRTREEAARFLARSIEPDARRRILVALQSNPGEVMSSFRLGMSVRNTLRSGGFTEESLGVSNLDDVWYELLEAAVRLREA
jgi:hypothetical protein